MVFVCRSIMYHPQTEYTILLNGRLCPLDKALVMAIVNVTPDSFYSQSRVQASSALLSQVEQHVAEGADIIDLGACSTRPGATMPGLEEEKQRLLPALETLREHFPQLPISVDTFRAEIARIAVQDYGVSMINDVSAGELDERMFETVAECRVPYVLTHSAAAYTSCKDNSPEAVLRYLAEKLAALRALGVSDVIVDPGFGFGKSLADNYRLLRHLPDFGILNAPLLIGLSRKRMAYEPLGLTADEALNATTVLHTLALQQGAHMLRVHDVKAAVECIKIMNCYRSEIL